MRSKYCPKSLKFSPVLHNFSKIIKKRFARWVKESSFLFFWNPSRTQIVTFTWGQKGCDYLESILSWAFLWAYFHAGNNSIIWIKLDSFSIFSFWGRISKPLLPKIENLAFCDQTIVSYFSSYWTNKMTPMWIFRLPPLKG